MCDTHWIKLITFRVSLITLLIIIMLAPGQLDSVLYHEPIKSCHVDNDAPRKKKSLVHNLTAIEGAADAVENQVRQNCVALRSQRYSLENKWNFSLFSIKDPTLYGLFL